MNPANANDFAVLGGGIVGLATAMALGRRYPAARILVIEKENKWGAHQTGHNSGVIHSGIYYKPGTLKARFCRAGNRSMIAFCETNGVPYDICGKVIVATRTAELEQLDNLVERGKLNGVKARRIGPEEVRELEPHVSCLGGVHVPETGIVDFAAVCRAYAHIIETQGGELRLGCEVTALRSTPGGYHIGTARGDFDAQFLINCTGLHSDRVARLAGADPGARIVPFRGEYYQLRPERRGLVRALVYPVPNPAFPFLGVHFTRMIDGSVHAGPNAVPGLKREGYRKRDVSLRDAAETFMYPGFWRLLLRHHAEARMELYRSFSKAAFVRSLQRMIPEVTSDDLIPAHSGVRAQALLADGQLVDDFLLVPGRAAIHVCNAPSPAATSSIEIGEAVVDALPAQPHLRLVHPSKQ
ncbi:MAG TPA: L-2-hydroxyglutarate oxidase [Gemmatimonadaceae bacterium]